MGGICAAGDGDRVLAADHGVVDFKRAGCRAPKVDVQFVLAKDEVRDRLDAAGRRQGVFDDVGV